jgi:hypothetical protein
LKIGVGASSSPVDTANGKAAVAMDGTTPANWIANRKKMVPTGPVGIAEANSLLGPVTRWVEPLSRLLLDMERGPLRNGLFRTGPFSVAIHYEYGQQIEVASSSKWQTIQRHLSTGLGGCAAQVRDTQPTAGKNRSAGWQSTDPVDKESVQWSSASIHGRLISRFCRDSRWSSDQRPADTNIILLLSPQQQGRQPRDCLVRHHLRLQFVLDQ